MTISLRASSHGNSGGSSTSSLSVTMPTFQAGDVVVVDFFTRGSGTGSISATGWSSIVTDSTSDPTSGGMFRLYRVMQSSDPSAVTFTLTSASPVVYVASAWVGVNNAAPIDGNASANHFASTGAPQNVTTGHGSAMLIAAFGNVTDFTVTAAPAGWTQVANDGGSGVVGTEGIATWYQAAGVAGAYSGPTVSDGNTWRTAQMVALNAQAPPLAPTLNAPVNATYQDLASGFTFAWTYNPATSGVTQTAYALRRKIGAGAYEWWNAGTVAWQGTEVFNSTATQSVAFAAAKWTNGNTYSWSVATQDSNGTGAYSADFTVTASTPPTATVTAPTGTVAGSTPSVTWTETLAGGAAQTAYRVVVESGAYGTTPGSGTTAWDSGVVNSTALTTIIGTPLANNTSYRAFVQVTETGGQTSAWAFNTFTVTYNTPATPSIIAVWDSTLARCALTVQGRDNLLNVNISSLETNTTGWNVNQNSTIARSTAQSLDGTASLSITSVAAGDMGARTDLGTGATVPTVTAGKVYTAVASFRSAVSPRACSVRLAFLDSSGSFLAANDTTGTPVGDNTASWVQAAVTAQAPTTAVYACVIVNVLATGGAAEVHYVDRIGVFPNPLGNLVNNPDFENSTAGYSAGGGSAPTVAMSTAQAYTGRAAMLITWPTTTALNSAATTTIAATSGVTYTVSKYVYVPAGSPKVALQASGAAIATTTGADSGATTNTWLRLTLTVTATSTGTMNVSVVNAAASTSGQTCYVDAVQVVVGSAVQPYVPPSVSNLITNPSFDADLAGWAAVGGSAPTATRNTSRVYPGSLASALLTWVTGSSSGTAGYTNQGAYVAAGQQYTFSAWVYVPSGGTAVNLLAYGQMAGTATSAASTVNDAWQRLTVTFTPTTSGNITLQISPAASTAAGSVVYVDATQLELGATANAYVGGALGPGYSWDASQNLLAAAAASFEDGTVGGWAALGTGTTVANSATRAQDGTKSLLVTLGAGAAGGFGASVNLTLAPNTTYTYSVYIYLPSAGVASTELQVSGTGVTTLTETPVTTTNSFVRHALTFTTNATGGTVTIKVLNGATSTAGQTFFIDAAQVEQRTYATPYNQAGTANAATSTYQQPWTIGGFAATGSYTIEASEDGGTTWTAVRGSGSFTVDSAANQVVTAYDYERTPLVTATYRARVSDGNGASRVTSLNSPTAQATSSYTSWWIKDPVDPTLNAPVNVTTWAPKVSERAGTFIALGRSKPIVVSDSIGGMDGTVTISTFTQADVAAVKTIMTRQRVLLLQSPMGEQFYIRINADRTVTLPGAWAWQRDVQLPYVESDAP